MAAPHQSPAVGQEKYTVVPPSSRAEPPLQCKGNVLPQVASTTQVKPPGGGSGQHPICTDNQGLGAFECIPARQKEPWSPKEYSLGTEHQTLDIQGTSGDSGERTLGNGDCLCAL